MTSPGILVRFFGRLAEQVQQELVIEGPIQGLSVGELRRLLAERFDAPTLLDKGVRVVVGCEVVPEQKRIQPGEEVEFLAPLSGG